MATISFARCVFGCALLGAQSFALDLDQLMDTGVKGVPPNTTVWTKVESLGIRGCGWPVTDLTTPFTRLPRSAQSVLCSSKPCSSNCTVPGCPGNRCDVWGLSQTATGLYVQFSTTANQVHVKWSMEVENGDWLWPINGHSGIDFYVQDANSSGVWRWGISSGNNPGTQGGKLSAAIKQQTSRIKVLTATLGVMADTQEARNITVYLPSRGTVYSVEVGVAPGETIAPFATAKPGMAETKPVAVYGTSILHAAASGRAGMVYSSQMQRYINRPVLNLGFSGNGLMEHEVAMILSELDPSIFVLDCEYNMDRYTPEQVECLTYEFIKTLRNARPTTPVLLMEGHDGTKNWLNEADWAGENGTRNGYRNAYNKLVKEGEHGVYYLNGSGKLGGPLATDFEAQTGAIGGVHVSNFAFMHFAHYIGDMVEMVLNGSAVAPHTVPLLPVPPTSVESVDHSEKEIAESAGFTWIEASDLGLEGRGWVDTLPKYGRLPASAEASVGVGTFNLSQCSTGVLTRFTTNATTIYVQVVRRSLGGGLLSLTGGQDDIMAYNGRFGIDMYAADDNNEGKWRWFETSASSSQSENATTVLSVNPVAVGKSGRDYTIYFPTHIAVDSLKIGVNSGHSLTPYRPHAGKSPVLIWASSIGQGGVVQNSGMAWINQVGRTLEREVYNFGFSGDCLMQPEVADYLVQLKPSVFVVDCLPNMNAASVAARASDLFKQLRAGLGPTVPILVLEGHTYSNAWVLPSVQQGQEAKRAAQQQAFTEAAKTDEHIHYVTGDGKLSSLGENQFDATSGVGVHPTNIAHYRIGEYVAQHIKSLPDWE